MEREPLDPTRLIWLALVLLASFGLGVVMLRPPQAPEPERATPGPSPETASLQCLDGRVFQSIDELAGQPTADGFPTRGHWTVSFQDGRYVLDQSGVHEAGRYRCDGARVLASSPLASHRGHLDSDGARLAWDGQGFEERATEQGPSQRDGATTSEEAVPTDAPQTVSTSG